MRKMNTQKNVLIVEDTDIQRDSYAEFFEARGYNVTSVSSPKDATNYLDREFDLVILDGLEGQCFDLIGILKGKRKAILTGSSQIYGQALEKGIEAHQKGFVNLKEFLEPQSNQTASE